MIIASSHSAWPTGPFSAVRPAETPVQEPTESSPPEPIDEVVPGLEAPPAGASRGSMSTGEMSRQSERSAGAALAAFPQVVHLLANPELHLGQTLAEEMGLPLVSLAGTTLDDLDDLLAQPQFADGFILEGMPQDRAAAAALDGLLSATDPNGRRVLGFDSCTPAQQEIQDHYIDQGLMWLVPSPEKQPNSEQTKSSLLECLVGLPAWE